MLARCKRGLTGHLEKIRKQRINTVPVVQKFEYYSRQVEDADGDHS
jgi:hypothetical protein